MKNPFRNFSSFFKLTRKVNKGEDLWVNRPTILALTLTIIVIAIFLFASFKLYSNLKTGFESQIAEKELTIAEKNSVIANKDAEINRINDEKKSLKEEAKLISIIHRDLVPNNMDYKKYVAFVKDTAESGKNYVTTAIGKVGNNNINIAENRIEDVIYAADVLELKMTFAKILASGIAWTKSLPWHKATLKDTTVMIYGDGDEKNVPLNCKIFDDDSLHTNADYYEAMILRNPALYNRYLALADSVGKRLTDDWYLVLASYQTNTNQIEVPGTVTKKAETKKAKSNTKKATAKKKRPRL